MRVQSTFVEETHECLGLASLAPQKREGIKGSRFVRQPNGLLALFSDRVHNFTVYNMTPQDAADVAESQGMTRDKAWTHIGCGIDDVQPWPQRTPGDGLSRWRLCLEIIRAVFGPEEAAKRERLMSEPLHK